MFVNGPLEAGEIRIVKATGEYRMGDRDTLGEAQRLALLQARLNAIEQAGVYMESLTELNQFRLTRDQLTAYAAGILQVIDQTTRTILDGNSVVHRAEITVRIDSTVVPRQIVAWRQDNSLREDFLRLQREISQLRDEIRKVEGQQSATNSQAEHSYTYNKTIDEILAARASELLSSATKPNGGDPAVYLKNWGILAANMTEEFRIQLGVPKSLNRWPVQGVIVVAVQPAGPTEGILHPDDVIFLVNKTLVSNVSELGRFSLAPVQIFRRGKLTMVDPIARRASEVLGRLR